MLAPAMMQIYKLKILSILLLFVMSSCRPNFDKIFEENNDSFELNRPVLQQLIRDIEKTCLLNWDGREVVIPIDSFNRSTTKMLKDLGIGSIEITNNPTENCDKNYCISLNVIENWNIGALRVVKLIYAPCDKKTVENFHYYDGYHRDSWGQGDNWLIYSDTDFMQK